jgi:glycosyltransferase involved in cell wall biosynthesis
VIVGNCDIVRFRGWLIRDLTGAGHRVYGCAPDDPALARQLDGLGATFVPISIARTGTNPLRDFADIARLARLLRSLKADVVLSHGTKSNVFGPLAARLAGVRRIFVMVEGMGYAFTDGGGWKRRLLRTVLTLGFGFAFRLASGVFVLNETDRDFVRKAKFVSARQPVIKVNGTGIDLEEFAQVPPSDSEAPCFLLIARILREKGICEFAEAARMLRGSYPQARFQLLGRYDSNPGALAPADVERWQQEGLIEYLGHTDDVRPFLHACSVYVLPSWREGMPRTIMEAMAVGRAIVTTDVPGCRETVVEGDNGFMVPAREPRALAAAMRHFIENPKLAATMGARSRALAERRFDVHQVNRQMMQAIALDERRVDVLRPASSVPGVG